MDIYFRDCPKCGARQRVDVDVGRGGQLVDSPVQCECEKAAAPPSPVLEMEKRRNRMSLTVELTPRSRWKPRALREFVRDYLRAHPAADANELWEAAVARDGKPGVKRQTFQAYYYDRERRGVTVSGGNGANGNGSAAPAPIVEAAAPEPVLVEAEPLKPVNWSVILEETGVRFRLYERTGSSCVWFSIIGDDGKKNRKSLKTMDRALAEELARAIARGVAQERSNSGVGVRPGLIEMAEGEDSFTARRRADGDWDVEMRVCVDEGVMGQLAEVAWTRVVGSGRSA